MSQDTNRTGGYGYLGEMINPTSSGHTGRGGGRGETNRDWDGNREGNKYWDRSGETHTIGERRGAGMGGHGENRGIGHHHKLQEGDDRGVPGGYGYLGTGGLSSSSDYNSGGGYGGSGGGEYGFSNTAGGRRKGGYIAGDYQTTTQATGHSSQSSGPGRNYDYYAHAFSVDGSQIDSNRQSTDSNNHYASQKHETDGGKEDESMLSKTKHLYEDIKGGHGK